MTDSRTFPGRIVEQVELGTAELVPDPDRPDSWTLRLDGVAQSYVDLNDPTHLRAEYLHRVAAVITAAGPAGTPLRVLHLGGGGLTLPRYVAAVRAGSTQRVIERDGALLALVRRVLPLPDGMDVEVCVADARAAIEETEDAQFDLVIADVARVAEVPRSVASVQCAEHVARVLRPGGLYAINVPDVPTLEFARAVAATLRAVFADVCAVAEPRPGAGRRFTNAVFAAAVRADGLPVEDLTRLASREPFPGRLLRGADFDRFVADARPVVDHDGGPR